MKKDFIKSLNTNNNTMRSIVDHIESKKIRDIIKTQIKLNETQINIIVKIIEIENLKNK